MTEQQRQWAADLNAIPTGKSQPWALSPVSTGMSGPRSLWSCSWIVGQHKCGQLSKQRNHRFLA